MVALQFRLSFLLVLVTVGYCQTIDTEDLKEKIEESLDDKENIKNVVKVLGLDMSNFGAEDTDEKLCNLIKASSPEVSAHHVHTPKRIYISHFFCNFE